MRFLFFLTITLVCYSCKPLVEAIYGVNKEIEFKTMNDYRNYVAKKYKIDLTRLYYVDKSSYGKFLGSILGGKVDYFLGTFINDSIEMKKSDYLVENESCIGRVLKEINYSRQQNHPTTKVKNEILKNNSFLNIVTQEPINSLNDDKIKIVLIYSYKAGMLNKNDFVAIQNLLDATSDHELIIISIDNVFDLAP